VRNFPQFPHGSTAAVATPAVIFKLSASVIMFVIASCVKS